jgi:hypothetical protein
LNPPYVNLTLNFIRKIKSPTQILRKAFYGIPFSYGTLQLKSVQLANFGRELTGKPDTLLEYAIEQVEITDERVLRESGQKYHPILKFTGAIESEVDGTVFELTPHDLMMADSYEVSDYKRVSASLKSGLKCWVYVSAH